MKSDKSKKPMKRVIPHDYVEKLAKIFKRYDVKRRGCNTFLWKSWLLDLTFEDMQPHFGIGNAFTNDEINQLIMSNSNSGKKNLNFKDFVRMLCPSN